MEDLLHQIMGGYTKNGSCEYASHKVYRVKKMFTSTHGRWWDDMERIDTNHGIKENSRMNGPSLKEMDMSS